MKSRIVAFGCVCFMLYSFASAQSMKPVEQDPVKEEGKSSLVINEEINQLFADNVNLRDPKKMADIAKTLNKSIGYDAFMEEDLMNPAIDLYGEGSWNTASLLPFKSTKDQVALPDSFCIDCSQFIYPLDELEKVTSNYGYRRRFGRMHYGIDLNLNVGDTVRAAFDGKVRLVEYDRRGYGKYVVIRHPNGLETLYGHLSAQKVEPNQIVRAGDPIGLGGSTGRSTGPHLHFETRFLGFAINPAQIVDFKTGVPRDEQYLLTKNKAGKSWSGAKVKKSGVARSTGIKAHKIRRGDTLSGIAKRYGVSINKLCQLNGISKKTTLKIGRTLRVSS